MAAPPPSPPPRSLPKLTRSFKLPNLLLQTPTKHSPRSIHRTIKCCKKLITFSSNSNSNNNITSNWTIDCISTPDPTIHFIKNPPSSMSNNNSIALDPSVRKRVCLFYCQETEALAKRIAAQSDAIELRSITWRKFEDGFPNLFISNAQAIRGQHVVFLASFSSPGVIFEQLSIIYALPKLFVESFTLVLPFFPTGTYKRMEDKGDVATAFTLARILCNIPISRGGPTSLVNFDIHALQERFYFGDNILPCFESGIPLLKNRLQELPDSDNIAIAFPVDGAWKRFHKQCSISQRLYVPKFGKVTKELFA